MRIASCLLVAIPAAILLYHWVLFPLLLALLVRLRRPVSQMSRHIELPRLSILIPTRNEEKLVLDKLRNCASLDYPADKLEVVVGSDGSTDRTNALVAGFGDDRVRLVEFPEHRGRSPVFNRLFCEARGELVLVTDVDVMLDAEAPRRMAERFADPAIGAVAAAYRRLNPGGSAAEGFYDRIETHTKELEGRLGAMVCAYGAALMVRRELCDPLPDGTILDDFIQGIRPFRRGYSVVLEPSAVARGFVESAATEFRRKSRFGAGALQAIARCRDLLSPSYGVKAWILFSHKILRMANPLMLISILVGSAIGSAYSPVWRVLLLAQLAVYLSIPLVFVRHPLPQRLGALQYFLLMNIAMLAGYVQYLAGRHSRVSDRPARACEGKRSQVGEK